MASLPDTAEIAEESPSYGPPIGSVAKVEWPELVGTDVDEAIAIIEAERSDMVLVIAVKEGAIVASDRAARRVRVYYDPATRKVTATPVIG